MLISCPNCTTNFSVPDKALGSTGRTLKCAKCGHKWHQKPLMEDDLDLDLDGPSLSTAPAPRPRFDAPAPEPRREPSFGGSGSGGRDPDLDIELDDPPIRDIRVHQPVDGYKTDVNSVLDEQPPSIPDVFSRGGEQKKGTGGLWVLVLLLLLGGIGGAGYYFQDKLIEIVPEAADLLDQAGLRHEKPGAGLQLRSAGTPERFVHNDNEVLIVRGVIANVTERQRTVPTMKLVLLDKNKQPVQEKVSQPPVTTLEPQGTASFKIILERPDPNAVEVNVIFVDTEVR